MSDSQTKVTVYRNGKLLREHTLPPGEYVVAQDGEVETFVPGKTAEGPKLHLNGEQRLVEDPGTMDGTIMDGESVTIPTVIMPGQKIRCGDREIVCGWSPAPAAEETRPEVLVRPPSIEEIRTSPRYGTMRKLTRGGMGVIMAARDAILQREVVVKFMRDSSKAESVARFYQEAQITAQLEHPNIVPVHELALNEQNQPFYTMKRVRGLSLKSVLVSLANNDPAIVRQWPLSALLTVFQKVCDAIAFAHAAGVIHRDLKPDNIMLGEYGEVQVMDWGLAKVRGRNTDTVVHAPAFPADSDSSTITSERSTIGATLSGTVIGTPQYMPPEQAKGEVENLDESADIYALGAILYHMLALRPPFNGRNQEEVLVSVRRGEVVPFADAVAGRELPHLPGGRVPISLTAVCRKAMSFEKTLRYPAVKILQNEIEAYQTGFAPVAEDAGVLKLAALFFRRHRTISLAIVGLLLAGVIFAFNLKRERDRATVASVQAQAARRVADVQRNAAEDQLYLSEMLQAGRALADGRPQSARDLLARHLVETSGRNLRGWEWYFLLGEANQDRLRVHAHSGGVFAVAASADGERIATGGGDGEVAVWQARGLAPQFRLKTSGSTVVSVDWYPGGRWLAAGCADGLVCVWDTETRKNVAELRLESPPRVVRWRPIGPPALAIGNGQLEVLLWEPQTDGQGNEPQTLFKTHGGVAALHWSRDGRRLAVGELGTPDPVEVFDFDSRQPFFATHAISGSDVLAVALDPSGRLVAAGSKHLVVAVHRMEPKSVISTESLHRSFVSALAWSPDGNWVASASHDGTIRLTSPEKKEPPEILSGHRGEINALVWARLPGGTGSARQSSALFSGGADGTLRAWTVPANRAFTVKDPNWIAASNWNPEGTRIAVAHFRNDIHLADPATGQSVPIHTARGSVFDVVWSAEGDRLATASRSSNCVETFDAASGRPLGIFDLPGAYRVAWSPTGRYLAACGADGARVWEAKTGALLVVISRPAGCVTWHPDERRIILGGDNGAIELWDAFAGKLAATWRPASTAQTAIMVSETEPPHQVFDMRWNSARTRLAFTTQDSVAGILDGRDGRLVKSFGGHTTGVWRVAWNSNDQRVATVGQDGVLRIFDVRTGGQLAQIRHGLGNSELHGLDWERDGQRIVSGGFDLHARVWDAARGQEIDTIEQLAAQVRQHPDLETARKLARTYSGLGWVGEAREAWRTAQALAPGDSSIGTEAGLAEVHFATVLDAASSSYDPAGRWRTDAMGLLNAIHDSWQEGRTDVAVKAWQDLQQRPDAERFLPLARTYFGRARWQVAWFPFKADPIADPEGWRDEATGAEGVSAEVRSLSFPYLHRGPKDLFLNKSLTLRGPGGKNFGMVANARVSLTAGKWRVRVVGGGGARVLIAGRPVLEKLSADAPSEQTADYEQEAAESVVITVEHFVRDGTDGFEFQIEPVAE